MNEEDKEAWDLFLKSLNSFEDIRIFLFYALKSINERLSELEEDE